MSTRALSVALPSEVIYVSGTVNDVAYTWTRMDDAWRATVERAADERYRVSLTAVNSLGTSASYDLTLYYGLQGLITDRTEADAARVRALADKGYDAWTAAELAWWRSDLKGGYNASDLNRVGSAVDYVAKRLRSCGIFVSVAPRMDWANGDKPNRAEMASYLADIAALRAALPLRDGTPPAPGDMLSLTWEEANAIESILLAVDDAITRMSQAWYYSGDLYAGEV